MPSWQPKGVALLVLKPPSWEKPVPVHFTTPQAVFQCYFKKLFAAGLKCSKFKQIKIRSVWLLDITAEVKSTCSFRIKSLMFTNFFEVAVTGCYNHVLYCYCQAPVVHLLLYNPVVLAKGWCWILCWELPFHLIFWQPVYLRCLVIPWNILFKILYAFCNQIDLTLESQKCITVIFKDLVCICRKSSCLPLQRPAG